MLPLSFATKTPPPAGMFFSLSGTARSFARNPSSSFPLFSLRRCCHFSKVPVFRLLRQKNNRALIKARPTKPPITPPTMLPISVSPLGFSVSPLPSPGVPVLGDMIPAEPPVGMAVGCDDVGSVSEELASGNADCAGSLGTIAVDEAIGTVDNGAVITA